MDSTTPSPIVTVKLTVEVPADRRGEFLHLVQEFHAGKIRVSTPVVDFQGKGYREAVRVVLADQPTFSTLRNRIVEDDGRDALESLTDAEILHGLQSQRFAEAVPIGVIDVPGTGTIEEVGVEALQRLYKVACGQSGQCRYIAHFLLGLYNGARFPFDLTELRGVDDALYDDCMRVLRMDARVTRREVHTYFEDGSRKWEDLAGDWRVLDVFKLGNAAKEFAQQVGFSGPHAKAAAEIVDMVDGGRE